MSDARNIRTWADWVEAKAEGHVTEAEIELMKACEVGEKCILGDGKRPEGYREDRKIGADILAYLCLGGCSQFKVPPSGVWLEGAFVRGSLDLAFCTTNGRALFDHCYFDAKIEALHSKMSLLSLEGSHIAGLRLENSELSGSLFLRNGFKSSGAINLLGCNIAGQLEVIDAELKSGEGEKHSFLAQGVTAANLIWKDVTNHSGHVSFVGAKVEVLTDNKSSWDSVNLLQLDGFRYNRLRDSFDPKSRLKWLKKSQRTSNLDSKDIGHGFSPQPYEQLAWVLKRMGHDEEMRSIMIAKEKQSRKIARRRLRSTQGGQAPFAALRSFWLWLWDILQRAVIAYGYRPFRSVMALFVLFFVGTGLFHMAYENGDFAPNSAVILSTQDWRCFAGNPEDSDPNTDCLAKQADNPAEAWSADGEAGADYETFNRYAYAADIVVPIISLGQEEAWAPSTNRGDWGWHAWWARWVLKAMGWIVTALGAAAITGIIRRE